MRAPLINRNAYRFRRCLRRGMELVLKVEGKEIRIQNVVTSASLNEPLDLDAIVKAFPDIEWRPEVFPGLASRLKKRKTCTLLFKTGMVANVYP